MDDKGRFFAVEVVAAVMSVPPLPSLSLLSSRRFVLLALLRVVLSPAAGAGVADNNEVQMISHSFINPTADTTNSG